MKPTGKTPADNETFVTLIQLAQEDPTIRAKLLGILAQSSFSRISLLNSLIQEMKLKGAPPEFIQAIGSLLDDRIASKAADLIGR